MTLLITSKVTMTGKETNNVIWYRCKKAGHYKNQYYYCRKTKNQILSVWYFWTENIIKMNGRDRLWQECTNDGQQGMDKTCNFYTVFIRDNCCQRHKSASFGNVHISTSYKYDIMVKNVLCVLSLTTNLLSVSELIKNRN